MTISEPPGFNRFWAWLLLERRSRLANRLYNLLSWISSHNPVWLAGFALIAVGIICLYLSDQVVTGGWQGTLDAFGVGFIIGGIVDVLAISGLNQRTRAEDQRRETNNRIAESMIYIPKRPLTYQDIRRREVEAQNFLEACGGNIDPIVAHNLLDFVQKLPLFETPDDSDASQPPENG